MGGGVVHIGRQPHHVLDTGTFDFAQESGNLQLAPQWRTVIAVGRTLPAVTTLRILAVAHMQAERHVGGYYFPGGLGTLKAIKQPGDLRPAHEGALVVLNGLQVGAVGAAVTAHVHDKQVQQRALGQMAINPFALNVGGTPKRRILHERLGGTRHQQRHILFGVALVAADVLGV